MKKSERSIVYRVVYHYSTACISHLPDKMCDVILAFVLTVRHA